MLAGDATGDEVLAALAGPERKVFSAICSPLKQKGRVTGLFCLGNYSYQDSFDNRDAELLAIFADQVAIALENARLFQNLEKSLAELKDTQAKMVQTGKLAAVGQLAAGVAHELNNPIVGILGYSQYALEKIRGKDASQITAKDLENYAEVRRLHRARVAAVQGDHPEPAELLAEGHDGAGPDGREQGARDDVRAADAPAADAQRAGWCRSWRRNCRAIHGNAAELQQVFTNIIINAQKAMEKGGTLTVTSRVRVGVDARGRRRRDPLHRHRLRHAAREHGEDLRPVLHHAQGGRGDGTGTLAEPRHRQEPRGRDLRGKRRRQGHDVHDHAAAEPRRRSWRLRRTPSRRPFRWPWSRIAEQTGEDNERGRDRQDSSDRAVRSRSAPPRAVRPCACSSWTTSR